MFASIDFDYNSVQIEIKKINAKTANPSHFTIIAKKVSELTNRVQTDWCQFSVAEREELKQTAYQLLEPPQGLQKIWLSVWTKLYLIFIVLTNQIEAFYACQDAIDTLIDSILDAVEREDPWYQQVLSDSLEEIQSKKD